MIRLGVIIIILVSLSGGAYTLALLFRLRKIYHIDFLNSFLYYKILHFTFGVYGILGSIAIREILLKYDFRISQIESIVIVIPFFGIPFIIAAWYLLLKTSYELISRRISQPVTIIFFILATASFLVYGLIVRNLPENSELFSTDLRQLIRIAFYSIDLLIKAFILIVLLSGSFRSDNNEKRTMLIRFGSLIASLGVISALALHFAYFHTLVGLYFLLVYFCSDLILVLLFKSYLSRNPDQFTDLTDSLESIYQKYGISKRERQIITEICKGKTNQEIADELFISIQTVKDHTYNIFRKVNVRNRVELSKVFTPLV